MSYVLCSNASVCVVELNWKNNQSQEDDEQEQNLGGTGRMRSESSEQHPSSSQILYLLVHGHNRPYNDSRKRTVEHG